MNPPQLQTRIYTAAVLIAVVLVLGLMVLYSSSFQWLLLGFVFIVNGLCAGEFARMCSDDLRQRFKGVLYFLLAILPSMLAFSRLLGAVGVFTYQVGFLGFIVGVSGFFASCLFGNISILVSSRESLKGGETIARDLYPGLLLIGFCGACLIALAGLPDAPLILFWLLLVICCNDTAAYFVGSQVGGPRLAPVISPNKTISGSIAGILAGTMAGVMCARFLGHVDSWSVTVLLSVLVVLAGQSGDLLKSYLKRLHGVKDSGSILPGHGGVLDRVDGILMAAPVLLITLLMRQVQMIP